MDKETFMEEQAKLGADPEVTEFIADINFHFGPGGQEGVYQFFANKYCYYFAHMLKAAFSRGAVCNAAPYGHMVWVDADGRAYDISGVYQGEATDFIPEPCLGRAVGDFKHVKSQVHNTTKEEIDGIIKAYRKRPKPSLKCRESQGIEVGTPLGRIIAETKADEEYPGIVLSFKNADEDIYVACMEYGDGRVRCHLYGDKYHDEPTESVTLVEDEDGDENQA